MEYRDIVESQDLVQKADRFAESFGSGDVIAGGEAVAGIDTEADGQIGEIGRELPHDGEFFEAATEDA